MTGWPPLSLTFNQSLTTKPEKNKKGGLCLPKSESRQTLDILLSVQYYKDQVTNTLQHASNSSHSHDTGCGKTWQLGMII